MSTLNNHVSRYRAMPTVDLVKQVGRDAEEVDALNKVRGERNIPLWRCAGRLTHEPIEEEKFYGKSSAITKEGETTGSGGIDGRVCDGRLIPSGFRAGKALLAAFILTASRARGLPLDTAEELPQR